MATSTPRQRPSLRGISSAYSTTPTMTISTDVEVGDTVEVQGEMDGIVRFVGEVKGKKGVFVGVELSKKWANRGKNDGDVGGIHYFATTIRGAGIFLPIGRAIKRVSSPHTPNTFNVLEKESQRAPTPSLHPKVRSRPSLPRPESPLRRAMPAGGGGVTFGTGDKGGSRQSLSGVSHNRPGLTKVTASPAPVKMTARPQPIKNNPNPEEDEITRLRSIVQEKNDKIVELTADFDRHRADFRNTINTLDLASIETQRVYEKRIDDLLLEQGSLTAHNEDVVSVAYQLHQLEEVVQELEDGLEDARRGEAEARGEVEFLRGEVERVRAELRREKEKDQVQVSTNNGHQQAPVVVFDGDKWCALCEEDGHDSISCPYEKS